MSRLPVQYAPPPCCAASCGLRRAQAAPSKALAPELIGDRIKVRKPGVRRVQMPRAEGLADVKFARHEGFYRVAKTDTLVSIAEKFYGDTRYMRQLERNRDIINASGGVKRGMVLVIREARKRRASSADMMQQPPRSSPRPRAAEAASEHNVFRARSSTGQSTGLRTQGLQVRVSAGRTIDRRGAACAALFHLPCMPMTLAAPYSPAAPLPARPRRAWRRRRGPCHLLHLDGGAGNVALGERDRAVLPPGTETVTVTDLPSAALVHLR